MVVVRKCIQEYNHAKKGIFYTSEQVSVLYNIKPPPPKKENSLHTKFTTSLQQTIRKQLTVLSRRRALETLYTPCLEKKDAAPATKTLARARARKSARVWRAGGVGKKEPDGAANKTAPRRVKINEVREINSPREVR